MDGSSFWGNLAGCGVETSGAVITCRLLVPEALERPFRSMRENQAMAAQVPGQGDIIQRLGPQRTCWGERRLKLGRGIRQSQEVGKIDF
jgi:hypothetical protein